MIFNNRSVLHTVTGTLKEEDKRVFRQCNLAGSDAPSTPSQAEVAAVLGQEGISLEKGIEAFLQEVQ